MQLIVKKLHGEECTVEVEPTTTISELKKSIAKQLKVPAVAQNLLFLGRTLADKQTINSYPALKDGSKLFVIVKKPENYLDGLYEICKKSGMSDLEAKNVCRKYVATVNDIVYKLSLDDINRMLSNEMGLQTTFYDFKK